MLLSGLCRLRWRRAGAPRQTCGCTTCMGREAVRFVNHVHNRLEDIAAESGCIPKGAFVRWAMQRLSVQRGEVHMWAGHLT